MQRSLNLRVCVCPRLSPLTQFNSLDTRKSLPHPRTKQSQSRTPLSKGSCQPRPADALPAAPADLYCRTVADKNRNNPCGRRTPAESTDSRQRCTASRHARPGRTSRGTHPSCRTGEYHSQHSQCQSRRCLDLSSRRLRHHRKFHRARNPGKRHPATLYQFICGTKTKNKRYAQHRAQNEHALDSRARTHARAHTLYAVSVGAHSAGVLTHAGARQLNDFFGPAEVRTAPGRP